MSCGDIITDCIDRNDRDGIAIIHRQIVVATKKGISGRLNRYIESIYVMPEDYCAIKIE